MSAQSFPTGMIVCCAPLCRGAFHEGREFAHHVMNEHLTRIPCPECEKVGEEWSASRMPALLEHMYDKHSTTFSDSPPSSPNPCIDSSPPSSPSCEPPEFVFKEPYSASHNLTRPLRTYDKEATQRKSRTLSGVLDDLPRKRRKFEEEFDAGGEDDILAGEMDGDESPRLGDEELWEMETTKVVEEACGLVDLNGKGLTSISLTAIHTLQNFFVPSLDEEREHGAVVAAKVPQRTFSRTSSQMLGIPREEVRLFLARNTISHLPTELFDVSKLTVLAMPHNNLRVLPPEICRLHKLQTLNVSANKLQYLPSEVQQLSLSHLMLAHNPFLHPTKACRHQIFDSVIPPLSELCLRLLIKTGIMHYDVPPTMVDALHNCLNVPPSRPPSSDHGYSSITGLGKCVCGEAFVLHAEECLTWETKVAGCHIGESVPLKWRGCTVGCLSHLVVGEELEVGVERDPFEGDWTEDMGFRPIQFGSLGDDFDDE
ncbi:hypothetical protein BDZ89DRAFT_1153641 [Hymenopellis radicata]|nr:hypothetical protein BDZ89DRAFT_1153641 [Hymenopellis radicata]